MGRLAGALVVLGAAVFGVLRTGGRTPSLHAAPEIQQSPFADTGKKTPVVVELFTSEGCSDCPPADALLARLEQTQPVPGVEVITLEEHVDYWDHQGWADPFSSADFTRRQNEYAEAFRTYSIYTPQMVVDGRTEFVGSRDGAARQAIAEAARSPKVAVHLRALGADKSDVPLDVRIEKLAGIATGNRAEVFLAITESHLHSNVGAGENSGRKLDHNGVVRRLERIGNTDAQLAEGFARQPVVKLSSHWNRSNLRAIVFIQEKPSRHILGAAEIPLS
ncbi:MAG TPA: DUF1223 domain-containing protein [Candidatus Acidoferrales bacterium]|nr:DUF1223 domain-containing protein [Candidatus Acidoferrales bacterium]